MPGSPQVQSWNSTGPSNPPARSPSRSEWSTTDVPETPGRCRTYGLGIEMTGLADASAGAVAARATGGALFARCCGATVGPLRLHPEATADRRMGVSQRIVRHFSSAAGVWERQ